MGCSDVEIALQLDIRTSSSSHSGPTLTFLPSPSPPPPPPMQVPVTSWFDDPNDTELLDLIPFFEGLNKVDNVVSILGQNQTFQSPIMNTVSTEEEGREQE